MKLLPKLRKKDKKMKETCIIEKKSRYTQKRKQNKKGENK